MSSKIMTIMVMGVLVVGLTGCQGDERISEVSAKEKQAQMVIENQYAKEMETDLQTRQRFYQGASGIFEGMATSTSGSAYKIRVELIPNLPAFAPNRIRMREEVASDLNNLFFNAQVLLWNPESKLGAVGCLATGIRPDLNKGEISIASTDCPNVYKIRIHNQGLINGRVQGSSTENSAYLSRSLMSGKENTIQAIYGTIHPKTTSETLTFDAEKAAI